MKLALYVLTIALSGFTTARAATAIVFAGDTTDEPFVYAGVNQTIGWEFTVNADLIVTNLGFYNSPGGLADPHPVGIWDPSGHLVAQAVVGPSTTAVEGNFRYVEITPTKLPAGGPYVIGAIYYGQHPDLFNGVESAATMTVDPSISLRHSRWLWAPTLTLPSNLGGANVFAYFGPNFKFSTGPHLELLEPSDEIYYLDHNVYTKALVPLQARVSPPNPSNPAITWNLKLHTRVGWHERDIVLPAVETHQDDADPYNLVLGFGGNLEVTASSTAADGSAVENSLTIKIRGLNSAATGTPGTYLPFSVIATELDDDLQRAVCWYESSGFKQFWDDWDEGTPYISYNLSGDGAGTFDIGLMQINSAAWADNVPSRIEQYGWNWKANIRQGKNVLHFDFTAAHRWYEQNHLQAIMTEDQIWDDALCRYNTGKQLYILFNGQLQFNPDPRVQNYGLPYARAVRNIERQQPHPWSAP